MSSRVLWEGAFFSNHSLALVNRELVARLSGMPDLDVAIRASDADAALPWSDPRADELRALREDEDTCVNIHVRHQWPLDPQPPRSGKWVIMQPWEYGAIPRAWYDPMRFGADEVWVYSSWNQQCYIEAGIPEAKIRVIPLGVQPVLLTPPEPFPLQTGKRFRFLFVGGTIQRKGIDLLIDAYTRGFTREDDVCLVIKDFGAKTFYRNQTYDRFIRELQANPRTPEIEYIDDELTPEQMRDLYAACDCLVHPYRGEGFGLPIAEAMACGLPVMVPDQGGASDFCTLETAILLPSQRVPVPARLAAGLDTIGTPWWTEVSPKGMRLRMREVWEDPASVAAVARRGCDAVRNRFTWEASAAVTYAALNVPVPTPPLNQDIDAQHLLRMEEGVRGWERGDAAAALRCFAQARELRDTADAHYNVASVLLATGDARTAAPAWRALATRLQPAQGEEDRAVLAEAEEAIAALDSVASAPAAPGTASRIRWCAPIFNASGYASESRSFLEGVLATADWQVELAPHDPVKDVGIMTPELFRQLSGLTNQAGTRPHVDFQHGPAHTFTQPASELSVCRTMLETDRIPADWAEACNRFTEVWVPTEFNRETFARSGVVREKIRVVPGAIDARSFTPDRLPNRPIPDTRGFRFLSVFDFTPRKGWDLLLRAYFEEFDAAEDVSLVVKVVSFFRDSQRPTDRVRAFVDAHGYQNTPHFLLLDHQCSDAELRALYSGSDAFVLASRGEGWGRPYMEAMAAGLPTIGTRWSGNLEFMNDRNSFLVDIDGLEPCERRWSEMPLYAGHQWAMPSVASLRQQMRRVFEDRDEARARGERARQEIAEKYDVTVVGERFSKELERVAGR